MIAPFLIINAYADQISRTVRLSAHTDLFPYSTRMELNDEGGLTYQYVWTDEPAFGDLERRLGLDPSKADGHFLRHDYRWRHGAAYSLRGNRPVRLCDYQEALLMEGLDLSDASRLEEMRPRFLDLKLAVLRRLREAACTRSAQRLWEDCLELLTRTLSADEVEFLLRMDDLYAGSLRGGMVFDFRTRKNQGFVHVPGGLFELRETVGHFEEELTIGKMDKIRRAILGLPLGPSLECYFQAIGQPWRRDLDAALDELLALDARGEEFWKSFLQRFDEALRLEFDRTITVSKRLKARLCVGFEEWLNSLAEFGAGQLAATGQLPGLDLAAPASTTPGPKGNVFRNEGDTWMVCYEGETTRLRSTTGMPYLAHLLTHPHQEFLALELVRIVSPPPGDGATRMQKMGAAESAGAGFTLEGAARQKIMDEKYMQDVKAEIQRLDEAVEEAEEAGNQEAVDYYREQRRKYMQSLVGTVGRAGLSRDFATHQQIAANTVSRTIRRTLDRMAKRHPALHVHLKNSLALGTVLSYKPDRPITWQT